MFQMKCLLCSHVTREKMKTEFTADDRSKKYKACKLGVAFAKVNQGDGPMCGRPEAYT